MDEPKVVSYSDKRRRLPSTRVLLVVGVLLLALVAGAGFSWWRNRSEPYVSKMPGPLEDRMPQDIKEIQTLALNGKVAEAEQKIQEGLAKSGVSDETKYNLLTQKGITKQNAGDYKAANEAYRAAEVIKQEFKISILIADNAVLLSDKQSALSYYKKAQTQLNRNSPMYEAERERLEATIKGLEG